MDDAVIVGIGQMGATFAHGLLRAGRTVHPVIRGADPAEVARAVPEPGIVVVATGEADLPQALAALPAGWRERVALLQNELLPVDWERAGIEDPTVAVVWFEKKRATALHPILPTPVAGPRAHVLVEALEAIGVPVEPVEPDRLLFELVKKNLYILVANLAGLEVGGTVGELWSKHRDLARDVASEVLALQAWRAGQTLPHAELLEELGEAFAADPDHGCRGRSAPARLARALAHAREAELHVPTLARLAERAG